MFKNPCYQLTAAHKEIQDYSVSEDRSVVLLFSSDPWHNCEELLKRKNGELKRVLIDHSDMSQMIDRMRKSLEQFQKNG